MAGARDQRVRTERYDQGGILHSFGTMAISETT